jgi:hypothetical protein
MPHLAPHQRPFISSDGRYLPAAEQQLFQPEGEPRYPLLPDIRRDGVSHVNGVASRESDVPPASAITIYAYSGDIVQHVHQLGRN